MGFCGDWRRALWKPSVWRTVALQTDGTLWAWGHNILGQLGDGTNVDKNVPTPIH
ncbi:MAG: hypothetical protein IPI34_00940 [bacterium]|nr:hypothetical protein [bacterium]